MPDIESLLAREKQKREEIKLYNGIKFTTTEGNVVFGGDGQKQVNVSIEDDGIVYVISSSNNGYTRRSVVHTALINMERLLKAASEAQEAERLDPLSK